MSSDKYNINRVIADGSRTIIGDCCMIRKYTWLAVGWSAMSHTTMKVQLGFCFGFSYGVWLLQLHFTVTLSKKYGNDQQVSHKSSSTLWSQPLIHRITSIKQIRLMVSIWRKHIQRVTVHVNCRIIAKMCSNISQIYVKRHRKYWQERRVHHHDERDYDDRYPMTRYRRWRKRWPSVSQLLFNDV